MTKHSKGKRKTRKHGPLFKHPGQQIGEYSEWIVKRALQQLKQESRILRFTKKDRKGIDYDITLCDGTVVYLQVKSSLQNGYAHHTKHPDIPYVIVDRRTRRKNEKKKEFEKRIIQKIKNDIVRIFKI